MGSKVIALRYTAARTGNPVIRQVLYVDEGRGDRAIDMIKKNIEKMYAEKLFNKGDYQLESVETLWEESNTIR